MRRTFLLIALAALAIACGGNSDAGEISTTGQGPASTESETTTTPVPDAEAPATTEAEATATEGEDFCGMVIRDQDEDLDISDPEALEEALRAELERLTGLVDEAPEEIREDFEAFLEASEASIELYAEYDFDIFSIPESEIAATQAQLEGPQGVLLGYCGSDVVAEEDEGADPDLPAVAEDVPEGLFEPPGAQEIVDVSGQGTRWSIPTTASFEEVRSYYQEVLGDEGTLSGSEGSREATFSDTMGVPPAYVLWVKEEGDVSRVTIQTP